MKKFSAIIVGIVVALLTGCQAESPSFESAMAEAEARDALIMIDFYTDWCSWCRRLEEDTLSADIVKAELKSFVVMRVNAEDGGEELAKRFVVDGYPTIVFTNAKGAEVDRIVGYLPPAKFADQVSKIRTGDTFVACLARLDEDAADLEALKRSVEGLLERSDPAGAIKRLEAFDHASPDAHQDDCRRLMFVARSELHNRYYAKAGKMYRQNSGTTIEIPDTLGTAELNRLFVGDFSDLEADDQAEALRMTRKSDASRLLAIMDGVELSVEDLSRVAGFAYATGHYEEAGNYYAEWRKLVEIPTPDESNRTAWRLYLMRQELDLALQMAEAAYELDATSDIADTVARILYVKGDVEDAIRVESEAAEQAGENESPAFFEAVQLMREGADLGDRPGFESYPGKREG